MRVLLDECLPSRLKRQLLGHDVSSFDIAIAVLVAPSNSIEDLRPLAPRILAILDTAERRRVTLVST